MALVEIGPVYMPAPLTMNAAGANIIISAVSTMAWGILDSPFSGNIQSILFRTNTVTSGDTNFTAQVQSANATMRPSGNLFAANATATFEISNGQDNTRFSIALTSFPAVSFGQPICVVIQSPTAVVVSAAITNSPATVILPGYPHGGGPVNTTKLDQIGFPFIITDLSGKKYSSPNNAPGLFVPTILSVSIITNPDEIALYFQANFLFRIIGWWAILGLAVGISYEMNLYDDGNNTPLLSTAYDSDAATSVGGRRYVRMFNNFYDITLGNFYRLAFQNLTATNISVYYVDSSSTDDFDYLGFPNAVYSSRNRTLAAHPDAAAWSETAGRRPQFGLVVNMLSDGAGSASGGLLVHPGMTGGMRG